MATSSSNNLIIAESHAPPIATGLESSSFPRPRLLQSLLEELARHELEVRAALQLASKEQLEGRGHGDWLLPSAEQMQNRAESSQVEMANISVDIPQQSIAFEIRDGMSSLSDKRVMFVNVKEPSLELTDKPDAMATEPQSLATEGGAKRLVSSGSGTHAIQRSDSITCEPQLVSPRGVVSLDSEAHAKSLWKDVIGTRMIQASDGSTNTHDKEGYRKSVYDNEVDRKSTGVKGSVINHAGLAKTHDRERDQRHTDLAPRVTAQCSTSSCDLSEVMGEQSSTRTRASFARRILTPFKRKRRGSMEEERGVRSQGLALPSKDELQKARKAKQKIRASENTQKTWRFRIRLLLQSGENLITLLIVANAAVFGYTADYSVRYPQDEPPPAMRVIDLMFVVAFTVEIVLRMVASGKTFISTENPDLFWNMLDTLLVALALFEEFMLFLLAEEMDMSSARMLRLVRLVRIVRVIRVVRSFKDLRLMILGIMSCMKPFLWALSLLSIIMYVFAVLFLQFVSDELAKPIHNPAADKVYFSSLVRMIYTLFMCISGGVSWIEVAEPLIEVNALLGPFFILYIAFSVFCVLNIVTGLFVERATAMAMEDDDSIMMAEFESRRKWMAEIEAIFKEADKDGSGEIEWEEFAACLEDFRVQTCMKKLGVDMARMGTRQLWDTLDFDNSGTLEISEFAGGLQEIHGNARSIDICRVRHDQKKCAKKISKLQTILESNFAHLADDVAAKIERRLQQEKSMKRGLAKEFDEPKEKFDMAV